ncbi:hypothetical protein OKW39_000676 [Paraburkholderia sp. MM6662-R1]
MTRKSVTYTVQAEGRDKGKVFKLVEMPAERGEKWAIRALLALGRAGMNIPESAIREGMGAMARVGLDALMRVEFHEAEPLIDEMMECVSIIPDPSKPEVVRGLVADDIEEVVTRVVLRREVFRLHTGF